LCPTVAHESAGFNVRFCRAVWIGSALQKNLQYEIIGEPVSLGQRGVKRGLSGVARGMIHVGSAFNQKLTQPPVTVIRGGAQTEILTQRFERFAACEQVFYSADVAVVRAPIDQRYSVLIGGARRMAGRQIVEDQIRAPVNDSI